MVITDLVSRGKFNIYFHGMEGVGYILFFGVIKPRVEHLFGSSVGLFSFQGLWFVHLSCNVRICMLLNRLHHYSPVVICLILLMFGALFQSYGAIRMVVGGLITATFFP